MAKFKEKGKEYTAILPGWVSNEINDIYLDNQFCQIYMFYVIYILDSTKSAKSKKISNYGWPEKSVWKGKSILKKSLLESASLERNTTLVMADTTNDMKAALQSIDLSSNFNRNRDREKIVVFKNMANEMLSIFDHIRNALAHGRFALYPADNDVMFVMEDGVRRGEQFEVRARMILKKSTLLNWKELIENGPESITE